MTIKENISNYLGNRNAKAYEIVQYGFFLCRLVDDNGGLDLETLDFKQMASFTKDFSVVEQIHREQLHVLQSVGVDPTNCNLRHYALVSKSYSPMVRNAFICRDSESNGNDSGWYLGVPDDPLDANDTNNFSPKSLYEISIYDNRFSPFWLLPPGFRVYFKQLESRVEKAQQLR